MAAPSYDAIVIGGGHNGLVTAAYLARRQAGVRAGAPARAGGRGHDRGTVAGLQGVAGGVRGEPAVAADHSRAQAGGVWLSRAAASPSSFTPLPDGRSLLMGPEPGLNRRGSRSFSQRDAEQYPQYEALLDRVARALSRRFRVAAPDLLPLPNSWRRRTLGKRLRDARTGWSLYQTLGTLGADMPEALEVLTGAARPILDRWFESDVLKATLATDAIIGGFARSPRRAAPTCCCIMCWAKRAARAGCGDMSKVAWARCDGDRGACHDLGVTIQREAAVSRILTSGGKVRAWRWKTIHKSRQPSSLRASIRIGRSNVFWSRVNCRRSFWRR